MLHRRELIIAVVIVSLLSGVTWRFSTELLTFAATIYNITVHTNPDLEDGLVGHWTFDGKDMNPNARDRSGQGNHGNLTGFTSTTTAPGKIGQGLEFDGVDDFVEVGNSIKVDNSNTGTISGWVKFDTITGAHYILSYGGNNTSLIGLKISDFAGTNYLNFQQQTDGGDTLIIRGNTPLTAGNWYHLGITNDGIAWVLYVNGVRESLTIDTDGASTGNNGDWFDDTSPTETDGSLIGARLFSGSLAGNLDGLIDDVRIYNRALSQDEIKRLYNLGATTKINKTLTTNPDLENGLVGHWTFDGGDMDWASTTAETLDRSGNANNGDVTNFDKTSVRPGKIGQALDFDGVNDWVNVGDINIVKDITIAAWVNPRNARSDGSRIVEKDDAGEAYRLQLGQNAVTDIHFRTTTASSQSITIANMVTFNEWFQVVGTYDGTTMRLYKNGLEIGSIAQSGNLKTGTDPVAIGNTPATGRQFDGIIDDVRIYDRALSADEIKRLYDLGGTTRINTTITTNPGLESGLVGHWTFDGPDMNPNARDRSGQGNHGNLTGFTSTTTRPGKIGQALEFDKSNNQRVDIPSSSSLTNTKDGNTASVSMWVYQKEDLVEMSYFLWVVDSDNRMYIRSVANGKIRLFGKWSAVSGSAESSSGLAVLNTWRHLVFITRSDKTDIYVDGQFQETLDLNDATKELQDIVGSPEFRIAVGGSGSTVELNGLIDDVRIYDRALSAEEIKRLYDLGGRR